MLKKLISLNLALILIITLVPIEALAATLSEGSEPEEITVEIPVSEEETTDVSSAPSDITHPVIPTGLYWDGYVMKWENMLAYIPDLLRYEFQIFYSSTGDTSDLIQLDLDRWDQFWRPNHINFHELNEPMITQHGTGYYYFSVCSVIDDGTDIVYSDWSQLSPAYYYEMPEKLPAINGLYWDNGITKWANQDVEYPNVAKYSINLYYRETLESELRGLSSYFFEASHTVTLDLNKKADASGYYYFSIQLHSNDITIALDGEESELSPAYYYEIPNRYPSPVDLHWNGPYMDWYNMDNPDILSYEVEVYYGAHKELPVNELELVDTIPNIYPSQQQSWPALSPNTVYPSGSGYYYFRVKATPQGNNTESEWSSLSEGYYYDGSKGPVLAKPTDLTWQEPHLCWNGLNSSQSRDFGYRIEFFFGETEDGSDAFLLPIVYSFIHPGPETVVDFPFKVLHSHGITDGYCFFKVSAVSKNVLFGTNSEKSDLSPGYHYTPKYLTIGGTNYDPSTPHYEKDFYWYPGSGDGRRSATLHLHSDYSGGSIEIPVSSSISLYSPVHGDAGHPAIKVDGDATIFYGDSVSITGGQNAPAIEASGNVHISYWLPGPKEEILMISSGGTGIPAISASGDLDLRESFEVGINSSALIPKKIYSGEECIKLSSHIDVSDLEYVPEGRDRCGDVFLIWGQANADRTIWYLPGDPVSTMQSTEIYPRYLQSCSIPGTVGIILDGNGGKTANASHYHVTITSISDLHLYSIPDVFEKEDSSFLGFNTEPDGAGDSYQIGDSLEVDRSVLKKRLYAIWEPETSPPQIPDRPSKPSRPRPPITDNAVIEVTRNPDGSQTTTTIDQKAGTVTEVTKYPDNTILTIKSDVNGQKTITVDVPSGNITKITVPVENVTNGTVARLVLADGTEQILQKSFPGEDTLTLLVSQSGQLIIIDNAKMFVDVPESAWFKAAVDFVSSRNMMTGTGDNIFNPNLSTSRATIWTLLARLNGIDTSGGSLWYEKGRNWVCENKISDGSEAELMITREQLITMLWRFAGCPKPTDSSWVYFEKFSDASHVSEYAQEAMAWAVGTSIINGTNDGSLSPQGLANRAQVAQLFMNFVVSSLGN